MRSLRQTILLTIFFALVSKMALSANTPIDLKADCGAVGDGIADDTVAIQNCINNNSIVNNMGQSIFIPAGTYKVTSTITIKDAYGLKFMGNSLSSTQFTWAGTDSTSPMFKLASLKYGEFSDFSIVANSTYPLAVGIQLITLDANTYNFVSTANRFRNILIDGGTDSSVYKGVQFGQYNVNDANNDHHFFFGVTVANYRDYAFSLENTQIYLIRFHDCQFIGDGVNSKAGVTTALNAGGAGTFEWKGGGGSGNTFADFYIGAAYSSTDIIANATFTGSNRFLQSYGKTSAAYRLIIDSVTFVGDNGDYKDDNATDEKEGSEDGYAIKYYFPGPVIVRNSKFSWEDTTQELKFLWDPGWSTSTSTSPDQRSLIFEGNLVTTSAVNPTLDSVFTRDYQSLCHVPTLARGNLFTNDGINILPLGPSLGLNGAMQIGLGSHPASSPRLTVNQDSVGSTYEAMKLTNTGGTTTGTGSYATFAADDTATAQIESASETNDGGSLRFYTLKNLALTEQMRITDQGNIGIGITNPTNPLELASGAMVTDTGTWTDASDLSKKEGIKDQVYGLSEVLKMRPVSYVFKADHSKSIGFIAQEMEQIIPEVVQGEEGDKGISYQLLTAVLVRALSQQEQELREQEKAAEVLSQKNLKLRERLQKAMLKLEM